MTQPGPTPVTLVSRTVTGRDADGNDIYSETQTPSTAVFAPGGSVETVDGRDTVVTQPALYSVPVGTDLTAVDAVIVNGDRYEIAGDPEDFASPYTTWRPGLVVKLRKVTG